MNPKVKKGRGQRRSRRNGRQVWCVMFGDVIIDSGPDVMSLRKKWQRRPSTWAGVLAGAYGGYVNMLYMNIVRRSAVIE